MKIKELLEYGKNNLIKSEEKFIISKMLLKYLLNVDNVYLTLNSELEIEESISKVFKENIDKINEGMPIQYITNIQEFMKLNFYVDENVLIPQPDTEILVEEIINRFKENNKEINILDLCTGSGAIGVSLANYIKNIEMTMSDISNQALKIAKKNAINNNVIGRCKFVLSDMFDNINKKFDVIVSNPPYIKKEIIKTLSKEVQNEPILALDGGNDGLDFYRIIAKEAYKYLNKNGILALEIGYDQKNEVIELLEDENKYTDIYCIKDLSENDRVIIAKLK